MGPVSPTLLDHLRLLADAAGRAPAAPDAPLWGELFSPPSPYTSLPAAALEEAVGGYFQMLGELGVVCGKAGGAVVAHNKPTFQPSPFCQPPTPPPPATSSPCCAPRRTPSRPASPPSAPTPLLWRPRGAAPTRPRLRAPF